jgi:histidyl-tRNA synthetase
MQLIRRFMIETGTEASFEIDPSITRGLDYYTGIVYETFLNALPSIGSVCSGGRYDNLAALYSKESITGVGSSIGLDRLIAALESLGQAKEKSSYADVVIACIDETQAGSYQALAGKLRSTGIPCEVLLEEKKLTQQFVLAEKKGASFIIIPGSDAQKDPLTLRTIATRENKENLSVDDIINFIKAR